MYFNNQIIEPRFWSNGPAPGSFYNFGINSMQNEIPKEYTTPSLFDSQRGREAYTTGTSVVGLKFADGVMIAADNLISYGSLARFQTVDRVFAINSKTIIGSGGDYADFQSLKRSIDQKMVDDLNCNDEIVMKPRSLYNWLTRVLYNRRSRFSPLLLEVVVGGVDNDVPFLGHVDLRGRAYEDNVVASGFGKHLALPLLRERIGNDGDNLSRSEAIKILRKCMEVLYYRDCRAISKYTIAVATADGTTVEGPFSVDENWQVAQFVKGY